MEMEDAREEVESGLSWLRSMAALIFQGESGQWFADVINRIALACGSTL
jgi:hypothetical protein